MLCTSDSLSSLKNACIYVLGDDQLFRFGVRIAFFCSAFNESMIAFCMTLRATYNALADHRLRTIGLDEKHVAIDPCRTLFSPAQFRQRLVLHIFSPFATYRTRVHDSYFSRQFSLTPFVQSNQLPLQFLFFFPFPFKKSSLITSRYSQNLNTMRESIRYPCRNNVIIHLYYYEVCKKSTTLKMLILTNVFHPGLLTRKTAIRLSRA